MQHGMCVKKNCAYCLKPGWHRLYSGKTRGSTAEKSWFDARQVQEIFLYPKMSRNSGVNQAAIQWLSGVFPERDKIRGREGDHSLPPSAEVKNEWSLTCTPPYIFTTWTWANLPVGFIFTVLLTQLAVVFSVLLVSCFAQYHHELPHYAPIPLQHHHHQLEVEEYHHVSITP
jgi:hypothetical protein